MSDGEWGNVQLQVFAANGVLIDTVYDVLEAEGATSWHEIGGDQYVVVPWRSNNDFGRYANDRRITVKATNQLTGLVHTICDFIIESCKVEERSLSSSGGGSFRAFHISGRDQIKQLGEIPVKLRHISKYRQGDTATAITATTLQMNGTDTAAFPSPSLVGWTLELVNSGEWSQIVDHTPGGLLTIEPAWQSNVADQNAPPPALQKWRAFGAAVSETAGIRTDLLLAMSNATLNTDWRLRQDSFQSTEHGTFLACNDYSILKTLQQIAAQSGEYFTRVPGQRKIHWMRQVPPITNPQDGSTVFITVPHEDMAPIWYAYILPGHNLYRDTVERVTRIKPTGGGTGDEQITLHDLPPGFVTDPGFTIDGEYLISTAAESGAVSVSREVRFSSIDAASDAANSRVLAAQALYRTAHLWLKEHDTPRYWLDCEVQTSIPIRAVQQAFINIGGIAYDGQPLFIDMFVLEAKPRLKPDGTVTYRLKLSDKKAAIMTDERLVAEAVRSVSTQTFTSNAPARNSRGLDIDKSGGGGGGGGGGSHPAATSGNNAIEVSGAQEVSLKLASPSGLEIATQGVRVNDTIAGAGLKITNKIIDVGLNLNSGMVVSANAIGMGTPGTISAASANAVTGDSHTHATTTTANAKTTPNTILRGDINGDVGMRFLTADRVVTPLIESAAGAITLNPASGVLSVNANIALTGARNITTTSGSLTLSPAQTLIFQPTNNVVQINATTTLKTAHWASGFMGTGWGVTYDGALDARSIYADELHVAAFIADTTRVKAGADMITPSRSTLSRNFTIPALNATGSMFVEDMPGLEDMPVFADDDWVLLHVIHRPTGGLLVFNVWGQVSGYVDKSDGEQQWTFKTKYYTSATAVGKVAGAGMQVLDFGKSGDGWITLTSIDPAGSPYIDVATWQGGDPYTPGNIQHWYRDGQLRGITGIHEWGMRAGGGPSSHVKFSNLFNEIHGPRLSLYAGDHSKLQVSTVEVIHWRTNSQNTTLKPDADGSAIGVTSTAGNYWSVIDESAASPNHNDFVANEGDGGGSLFVGLSNPTWGSTTYKVDVKIVTKGVGFGSDTVRVYAQVFQSDEVTPLTGEALMRTQTNNSTNTTTVTLPQVNTTAKKADWDGARLRLRWEYDINTVKEAIRLDPNVPSIAVGNPLPTGYLDGGSGFWAGRDDGVDKVRIGAANGPNLRWTGDSLSIANAAGQDVVVVPASGTTYFANPVGLGASGGIYQGTGTFASPTDGLKISNASGQGRIGLFSNGVERAALSSSGIEVIARSATTGAVSFIDYHTNQEYGRLYTTADSDYNLTGLVVRGIGGKSASLLMFGYRYQDQAIINLVAGNTVLAMDSANNYARFSNASLFIPDGGVAAGYSIIPALGNGVFAGDSRGTHSNPQIVLQASGSNGSHSVAHGMSTIAATSTYGRLSKNHNTNGGLMAEGFSAAYTGMGLWGYAGTGDTTKSTAALGAVTVNALKKSGTGAGSFNANENLLIVQNNGSTQFIVSGGNGYYYRTAGTAYDAEDDIGLISAIAHTWEGTVTQEWERFIGDNKTRLQEIGVLSGDFINGPALNRLMVGAMRQMMTRINQLEAKLA